jgi:hypothetical protein
MKFGRSSVIGHRSSVIGHRSSVIGHRSSDFGLRLSAIGYRISDFGYGPLAYSTKLRLSLRALAASLRIGSHGYRLSATRSKSPNASHSHRSSVVGIRVRLYWNFIGSKIKHVWGENTQKLKTYSQSEKSIIHNCKSFFFVAG